MEEKHESTEWAEVRAYCLERPLERPNVSIWGAALAVILFLMVVVLVNHAIHQLCSFLSSDFYNSWFSANLLLAHMFTYFLSSALCLAAVLKRLIVGAVKLYQRYAPEEIRRKCILKPSCSEYMIRAVEMYGVWKGVERGTHRLLHTCRGWDYRIDEP